MSEKYSKDNKTCPRCGDLVGYIVSTEEIQVPYLTRKRQCTINTIYCPECGLLYREEEHMIGVRRIRRLLMEVFGDE